MSDSEHQEPTSPREEDKGKKDSPRKDRQADASDKDQDEKTEMSDGRRRQREFFREELRRLEGSLKKESSKIVAPPRQKNIPFVFNTLEPYYNTRITRYLVELPDENDRLMTFSTRNTAQGLTDPWIDLRMDREILPKIPTSSRPATRHDDKSRSKSKAKKGSGSDAKRNEGSTRLPKFPVVTLETKGLETKQLYYSDVPMLRKELKTKYSSQARSKVDADYQRTRQDFYRMDLDRLDQVAPTNRPHLTSAYKAYLQNTPGSRRAVQDCIKTLEGKAN
ncbi:uncharacterized protein LOC143290787 [Babylonia areolata]|uniref:uncharacterized protein LOC143290787 n=1 Tax=Babylonia areolata TaxID=304850 RepID=UPI003FD69C33